ncbi:MAG: helix-turn-helix domain-containing protein [Sphingomicrobium sp.]
MTGAADIMAATSRETSKRRTRQLLLDAARDVFLRVGYQGAKLDDIAAEAGFTKGALYWHFPNKQALFLALIENSIDANLRTLDGFLELGQADPAMLKARIGEWIDGVDARETLPAFGVELEVESRRDAKFRAVHQHMIVGHEAALTDFLRQYFSLVGDAPAMPVEQLASSIITIFKGFALTRQNRTDHPVTSAASVRLLLGLRQADPR